MSAGISSETLLVQAIERRHRQRRIVLIGTLVLLVLPAGAAVWLIANGSANQPVPNNEGFVELGAEMSKVRDAMSAQTARLSQQAEQSRQEQQKALEAVNQTRTKVDRLSAEIADGQLHAAAERPALVDFQRNTDRRLVELADVLNASDRKSSALQQGLADIKNSFAQLQNSVTVMGQETTNIRASVRPLIERQDDITARLAKTENTISAIEKTLMALDRRVASLEADVNQMKRPSWFRRMLASLGGKNEAK